MQLIESKKLFQALPVTFNMCPVPNTDWSIRVPEPLLSTGSNAWECSFYRSVFSHLKFHVCQSELSLSRHVTMPTGAGMVLREPFPCRLSSGSRAGWSGGATGIGPLHKLFSGMQTLGLTKAVLLIAKIIVKREGSLNLTLATLLGCCGTRVGREFEGQSPAITAVEQQRDASSLLVNLSSGSGTYWCLTSVGWKASCLWRECGSGKFGARCCELVFVPLPITFDFFMLLGSLCVVLSPIMMVASPAPSALTQAGPGLKWSWHLPADVYLCQSGGWGAQLMCMVHYSPLHCRKESHFLLCFSLGNCNSTAQ